MLSGTRPIIYYYYHKRCYFRLPRTRARGWEFALWGLVFMRTGAALGGLLLCLFQSIHKVCVAALKDRWQK